MKRVFRKIMSIVMVLFTVMTLLPVSAFAETVTTAEQSEEYTFVLVMDQTSSMPKNDSHKYYQTAAQMFIDMLPVENARAGIVGFGHKFSDTYQIQSDLGMSDSQTKWAHTISPVTSLNTTDNKNSLKSNIANIDWNEYSNTTIDAGLYAGVDMLAGSGTPSGQGCVILMTDGFLSVESSNWYQGSGEYDSAVKYAKEKGWPIYIVEVDYASADSEKETAHKEMLKITDAMNDSKSQTFQISSADGISDLAGAFMNIINSYYLDGDTPPVDIDISDSGRAEYQFTVEPLTAEENITIAGYEVSGVMLTSEDGEKAIFGTIDGQTTTYNSNEYEFSNAGQTYYNIKMILPKAGNWTMTVDAKAATTAKFNAIPIGRPDVSFDLQMPEGNSEDNRIPKNETFSATALLTYHGQKIDQTSLGDTTASIHYTNLGTGEVGEKQLIWNETNQDYEITLKGTDLGTAGDYQIYTTVTYTKNGEKLTITSENDPKYVYTYNQEVTATGSSINITDADQHYVRDIFDYPIDGIFENPDDDELTFKTEFDNSQSSGISIAMNGDNTALTISTGNASGTYTGTLKIWDPDMGEAGACCIPISITVCNHPMETSKIDDINMLNTYLKQPKGDENGNYTATVELGFLDEDQDEIVYTIDRVVNEGDDDVDQVMSYTLEGSTLILTSGDKGEKGKVTVTVSATDDDGTVKTESFTVVTATKSQVKHELFIQKIEKIGVGTIIAIVLVIIILIISGVIIGNTKIRGNWNITIEANTTEANGAIYQYTLNTRTDVLKKFLRKARLTDVIDLNTLPVEETAVSAAQSAESEFSTVMVSGVLKNNGCKIHAKKPERASLYINGTEIKNKYTLAFGEAEIIVNTDNGSIKIIIDIM